MIINRSYLQERMIALLKGKRQPVPQGKPNVLKKTVHCLWLCLPLKWRSKPVLRGIRVMLGKQKIVSLSPWAIDFVQYCFEHELNFDTCQYFPAEDEAGIQQHVDIRVMSVIGYPPSPSTEAQQQCHAIAQKIKRGTSICKGGYRLRYEGQEYRLPQKAFEINTFGYHYGLDVVPQAAKAAMAGKDFLDVGAYYGDSAIFFLQYRPRHIFAYEPTSSNHKMLLQTIAMNKVGDKVFAVSKGIGDVAATSTIAVCGIASSVLDESVVKKSEWETEAIEITTIDAECSGRSVGLIKMDVEGFELFAVKGGLATIERDKPVLLISIYHTAKDFFEIPPMLRAVVPEYKFRYVDACPQNLIDEKLLVGWV
ncbi:MAG: FkbM family methyltransferase [Prevotellaceae bacterium]|jgi:FkbM family methyltransferase|nr:FkbM family methyltransferase [Prevotellaceae bacterium]